ncbi:MAG: HTTM domain-containing protein [Polyangiales bacterium]
MRERFQTTRKLLRDTFLQVDVRTLGFARIAIGLLLLFDLAKRSTELAIWYTDQGVLPNALLAARPFRTYGYSLLFYVDSLVWVRVVFVLFAFVYLCFLFGVFTRVVHVLSWLCLVSLHVRTDMVANGGDFVFSHLVLWTAFLPLGAAFSIDARRREKAGKPPIASPHVSWAFLVVLLQLATIYYFNGVQKTGDTWKDGTAVYWLAHQERLVTWFGYHMRENLPLLVFQGLTYVSLALEYALPWLILSPWGRPWTRRLAILAGLSLHLGIAAVANVGLFSFVMITFLTLLISTEDWEWLRTKFRAWRGEKAPVVEALTLLPPDRMPAPSRSPWRWVSGLALAFLFLVATSQVLVENGAVPRVLRVTQPAWVKASMMTFRLYQGWAMFAKDAPRGDSWVVVDAVTEDGRHVDPLNEVASRYADPSLRELPPRLGQNYYWCDYVMRIGESRAYRSGLGDWIYRYHERTGDDDDRIVAFRAYRVTHNPPSPGETEPTDVAVKRIMRRSRR